MDQWIKEFKSTIELEKNALESFLKRLDEPMSHQNITRCIQTLNETLDSRGKIILTGMGKSGKIAQKIAATLCSTGSFAVFMHPAEGIHGDLGILQKNDTILAISQSGNTYELLKLLPSIKKLGIPIISISGNPQSELVTNSIAWLNSTIEKEACPHNLAPTSSTTLALAIGDALAITLMKARGFPMESFAQNHPGGSLGNKLTLKVSDLMHNSKKAGSLGPSASIEEVVHELTEKKLGAVCIVENAHFLGLITDGDLRRALKRKEEFFQLKASDILCKDPVKIKETELALHALELMENRPSQINILPVFNKKNEWTGVLRLHDIVKNI